MEGIERADRGRPRFHSARQNRLALFDQCYPGQKRPRLATERSSETTGMDPVPYCTRATGSTPIRCSKALLRVFVIRPTNTQVRLNCRGRSPAICSILIQLFHQLFKRQSWDWLPRWRPVRAASRGPDPPLAYVTLDSRLRPRSRRHNFGAAAATIGDDDGLARRRQTDIFAKLFPQNFEADCAHACQVAFGSYFVNEGLDR
jgi:hypothetical protein